MWDVGVLHPFRSIISRYIQPTQEHLWLGCFIDGTLMVVKGVSPNGCASHTLQPCSFDFSYLQHLRSAPVKVAAKTGKKWILDPYPSIAHMCDMLWLYAKDPVATFKTHGYLL